MEKQKNRSLREENNRGRASGKVVDGEQIGSTRNTECQGGEPNGTGKGGFGVRFEIRISNNNVAVQNGLKRSGGILRGRKRGNTKSDHKVISTTHQKSLGRTKSSRDLHKDIRGKVERIDVGA